jgi:hypothetical protein
VLQGDPTVLQPVVDQARLKLLGADEIAALKPEDKDDVLETVEAVVAPNSLLIGNTPQDLHLRQNYEVNLLALSRAEERATTRLRASRFAPNDILVLQGRQRQLARALTELACCRWPNAIWRSAGRAGDGCRCSSCSPRCWPSLSVRSRWRSASSSPPR